MGTNSTVGTYIDDAADVVYDLTPNENYALANNYDSYFYPNMVSNVSRGYPVIYDVDAYYFYNGYGHVGHCVLGNGYGDNNKVWFWDVNGPYADMWQIAAGDMSEALNGNGGYYIW